MARMYRLARKVNGKWTFQPGPELPKTSAVHYYQTRLLNGEGELRPVPGKQAPDVPMVTLADGRKIPVFREHGAGSGAYVLKVQPGADPVSGGRVVVLGRGYHTVLGYASLDEYLRLQKSSYCIQTWPNYDGGSGLPGDAIWLKA